ncbi:MAG: hypothetical protein ABID54_09305 [Pseudomonadota bacterium]
MPLGEICWNSEVPTCLCVARRQVEGEPRKAQCGSSDPFGAVSLAERKGKASPVEAGRG